MIVMMKVTRIQWVTPKTENSSINGTGRAATASRNVSGGKSGLDRTRRRLTTGTVAGDSGGTASATENEPPWSKGLGKGEKVG